MVSNSLPPTAQVGGAVIKSPKLPLPPIQLPNTAPTIITTPSKQTVPPRLVCKEPVDADKNEVDSQLEEHTDKEPVDTKVDNSLQSNSNVSVDNHKVNEVNNNNNININITDTLSSSTEIIKPSFSPVKTTKNTASVSSAEADFHTQKVKIAATKSPKKPLKNKKKVLSSSLSSSPMLVSPDNSDHSANMVVTDSLHNDKDDMSLPILRTKNPQLSPTFDVVTSLTGRTR